MAQNTIQANDIAPTLRLAKQKLDSSVAKDWREALRLYTTVAEAGNAAGLNGIGECHFYGKGTAKNLTAAAEYYWKAADAGDIDGVYNLGYCCMTGTGIQQNIQRGVLLMAYAIDHNHIYAAFRLGSYYFWGNYLEKDTVKGFALLKYAADRGQSKAAALVGYALINGYGVSKNDGAAKAYLDIGVRAGESLAEYTEYLGYRYGLNSFPKDPARAAPYLKSAAEHGHPQAMFEYGIALVNGNYAPADRVAAANWIKKAAQAGNEEAAARYTVVQLSGFGDRLRSQKELEDCRARCEQYAAQGDEACQEFLQEISKYEKEQGRRLSLFDIYPDAGGGGQKVKSGGCYVATAVYGSYDCPEVWTLRRFRDISLAASLPGRLFVHLYYAVSPTLVKLLGKQRWFIALCRRHLDPFVAGLKKKGYEDSPYDDKQW